MKILFVSSEAQPLVKTGGLADVSGSLPVALKHLQQDVRLVLPAYRGTVDKADDVSEVASLALPGSPDPVRILQGRIPGGGLTVYLVDSPTHFDRPGGPYTSTDGRDWPDNAERFALFCRAVCELAQNRTGLSWRPEVVHCNDWQSGLVPALLAQEPARPGLVFTVHNLSYLGLFPWETFQSLRLPYELWSMHTMEFHGQFSFLKGGLVFADRLTTVSPTYAEDICTPELGYGLDGLLRYRKHALRGILNGVDYDTWDPARDTLIHQNYSLETIDKKAANKAALLEDFGLSEKPGVPVIGMVTRLVEQKGVDLVLGALDRMMGESLQLVILGSGQTQYEQALVGAATRYPGLGVRIGYDERLAHLIEAGADMFLMPSRFEPCGLNQMYSLRYGTLPVVRRTGGLADTVVDATPAAVDDGTATGFVFIDASPDVLYATVRRALALYRDSTAWRAVMTTAMRQDFSWERSAANYLELYADAVETP